MPVNVAVKLGATVALAAAQIALGAMRKINGPRLDNTKVSLAEYNTPLPHFWGMRRFEGVPIIWAEDLREEVKKSKTKGGKYSEYRYYGTWAVAVAAHEIDAVTGIWFDKHLVFQRKRPGPISPVMGLIEGPLGIEIKLSFSTNLAIYLGTETQEPDPRMEAWFEDHEDFGPGSCSALRGTAYIVFKDIPLEKFGNRIPQIDVEAVSVKDDSAPWEVREADWSDTSSFNRDYTRFYTFTNPRMSVYDTATRERIIYTTLPSTTGSGGVGIAPDGFIYAKVGFPSQRLYKYGPDGGGQLLTTTFDWFTEGVRYAGGLVCLYDYLGGGEAYYYTGAKVQEVVTGFDVDHYSEDTEGRCWAVGGNGGSNQIGFKLMPNGDEYILTSSSAGDAYGMDNGVGQFFIRQNGYNHLVDKETMTIVSSLASAPSGSVRTNFDAVAIGAGSIWLETHEYNTRTLALIRSVSFADWDGAPAVSAARYDPINHALISNASGTQILWQYLDRASSNGVTLQDVVEDVGTMCGVDINAAALDQVVLGYSAVQGPGRDWIAPLLDIHHSILRPHDFEIHGIKHSTTSLGTITTDKFVREGDEKRYATSETQDTELPLSVTVSFADNNMDQQSNNVIALRRFDAVDSNEDRSIDLSTYADTANDMQHKADRFMRWLWNSRWTVSNALTAQYLAIEPGDVYTLDLDGEEWDCEVEKVTHVARQPQLDVEWRRTFPSLIQLGSQDGAEQGGRDPDEIFVPSPTKGFALDIPLVTDAHNDANPLLYYAAGDYGVGSWPGAAVYEGDINGDFITFASISPADRAVWGHANDALPSANPNLWDRGNIIEVRVVGTLTNSSEAAINANPSINMFALKSGNDWELMNFTTATLTGTEGGFNTYGLSGFLRGRRGTEWTVDGHVEGDEFILVDSLAREEEGLSDVGTDIDIKVQTFGRDPETAQTIAITYDGQTLMPYAPARIIWPTDGTDLFGTIIRRTRVGGAWTGGSAIPLSENSEAYEVDVMSGATVVRTITVTGTNSFTYTAAQMATDGNTVADPPDVNVYQISDAVGRGFALAA